MKAAIEPLQRTVGRRRPPAAERQGVRQTWHGLLVIVSTYDVSVDIRDLPRRRCRPVLASVLRRQEQRLQVRLRAGERQRSLHRNHAKWSVDCCHRNAGTRKDIGCKQRWGMLGELGKLGRLG
jgi:hypothetical protein